MLKTKKECYVPKRLCGVHDSFTFFLLLSIYSSVHHLSQITVNYLYTSFIYLSLSCLWLEKDMHLKASSMLVRSVVRKITKYKSSENNA